MFLQFDIHPAQRPSWSWLPSCGQFIGDRRVCTPFGLRLLRGFRLRWLSFELVELALYEGQILHVEKGDVEHVADNQDGAAGLDDFEEAHVYRFAADRFDEREHDMATVE